MTASELKRGRVHDADGAQAAILNAAEAVFAQHGFDGARIEAIARASSYNSGLIFHYFQDKLGLYTEIVKRADREMSALQARLMAPLRAGAVDLSEPAVFKALFEEMVAANFDYLLDHPQFMRILLWEQAGGWQTFARIVSQLDTENSDLFEALFRKTHSAGMLRSDFAPLIQLSMILQVCLSFLAFLPLYQVVLPLSKAGATPDALSRAREYIIPFVVHAMLVDLPPSQAQA
jgi:TetR/AcrR family transcriptional regulator